MAVIYGCFLTHLVLPNTEVLARVKRTYRAFLSTVYAKKSNLNTD